MEVSSPARQLVPRARRPGASLAWIGRGLLLLISAAALIILVRDFFANPSLFVQIIISGLQLGFVYALIALGYTMVYGIVKLINFAHGDVFMVGSFVSFYAVTRFQLHVWPAKVFPRHAARCGGGHRIDDRDAAFHGGLRADGDHHRARGL